MKVAGVASFVLVSTAVFVTACGKGVPESTSHGERNPGGVLSPAHPGEGERNPTPPRVGGSVTEAFGKAVVREGYFYGEASRKPWSGWWYPSRDPILFEPTSAGPAPLQKYDSYVQKAHNERAGATTLERDRVFNPNADSWEGLCNAWAVAAIVEPEPQRPAQVGEINFTVGDLKGLLTKTYEHVDGLLPYGQRYNGDRESVFDDLYPDQFHRIVQVELFERGHAFVMDKEPGVPVWNLPVWKVTVQLLKDSADPHVMHVEAEVVTASPFVPSVDYVGTMNIIFNYTYDLHGTPRVDGSLEVDWGEWTGTSRDFHPDFVTLVPQDRTTRYSGNTAIKTGYVDEILAAARR